MRAAPDRPAVSLDPIVGLGRRVARSFAVVGLGTLVARGLGAAALFIVLGHISRAGMGEYGTAATLCEILLAVTELGLGVALVQARTLPSRQIDALFWIGLGLAGGIYFFLFVTAPLVAEFFAIPSLVLLLRFQGLTLVFAALGLVPRALLTRELRFGRLTIAENVAQALSAATMIALASRGHGARALVLGEVVHHAALSVLCFAFRPYRPRLVHDLQGVAELLRFGLYATGSRLLYRIYVHADYLVIARLFGPETLGIYYVAYRAVTEPIQTLAQVTNQVAYPAFARLQDDLPRLRRFYAAAVRAQLTFLGIALVSIAVFIDEALVVLGYDEWLPAVPYVHVLALFGLFRCVTPLVPQLLNAVGQARLSFLYSAAGALLLPFCFWMAASAGPMGVAWVWATVYPAYSLLAFHYGGRALQQPLVRFVVDSFAGLPAMVPTLGLALFLDYSLSSTGVTLRLVVGGSITLLVGLGIGLARERESLALLRRGPSSERPGEAPVTPGR